MQWQNLLQHLGDWEGSFTRLTPRGEPVDDTPTLVSLTGLDDNRRIRQTIARFPEGDAPAPQVIEYGSLNRNTLVFEDGTFSVGSSQFGPFSEFGAEIGFVESDRRLRLVSLFNRDSHLSSITLIRERRQDTTAPDRPQTTVEQLVGTWQGTITTLYPDLRPRATAESLVTVRQVGDRLESVLKSGRWELTTSARIDGTRLLFDRDEPTAQVLLLPDGASCTTPLEIRNRQVFFWRLGGCSHPPGGGARFAATTIAGRG
ncbi:protein of unknown function (DUF3598) [Rubidibacter lacunae KORDI 51-2]|uniref:Uncharacterized protein n=1 Tax=Rubidibacter lacunae KORDI 51-2 TaxID=582515 RepID=U5DJL1_9CHRO|nr:protein of unknown function (DUF3598) [Rubidibacter lacunae KORDI 51-2]